MNSSILLGRAGRPDSNVLLYTGLVLGFGFLLPAVVAFFTVSSPFLGLFVLKYLILLGLMFGAFKAVAPSAPWHIRLIMCMVMGQAILNHGFSNIVVGSGSAKFTLAEAGAIIGLLFLLPSTLNVLYKTPAFWVCLVAITVPPAIHLYPDFQSYRMAALRDVLSVVDLVFFLGGMAVCVYGARKGEWVAWRDRFIRLWLMAAIVYGLTWPIAPFIMSISPSFQSYQQSVAVFGQQLTAPYNMIASVTALFAIPHVFPGSKFARGLVALLIMVGTIVILGMSQSRNMYVMVMILPVALAYFGYRKAFVGTLIGLFFMVLTLFLLEEYHVKIPGRISNVTLTAVADRLLSISGKHGDAAGAHGVQQRLDWWGSAINKWSRSPDTIVFGIGYGQALTNFTGPSEDGKEVVVVREPHNSVISSLVRGGLVYLFAWGWVVLSPMYKAFQATRLPGMDETHSGHFKGFGAWAFLLMFMLFISCLSEPIYEIPCIATIYYFIGGIFTMEYYLVTRKIIVQPAVAR